MCPVPVPGQAADAPALFAVIGTTYGNGSSGAGAGAGTDFNLPDLNNQFLRGLNEGRISGVDRALGSREAFATGRPQNAFSATTSSAGAHTHGYSMRVERFVTLFPVVDSDAFPSSAQAFANSSSTSQDGAHAHSVSSFTGGDSETRPRNLAMIYCIKF